MSDPSNPETITPAGRAAYSAIIERIFSHSADTRSFFLRLAEGADLKFVPGQFISLELPLGDERLVRPYSIASNPEDGQPIEICLNLVPGGVGSSYLFGLNVGSHLTFTGPYGRFTLDRVSEADTVFIAEATAIAPIRPMIYRAVADKNNPQLTLHHAAPTEDGLLYRKEFDALAKDDSRFNFEPRLLPATADAAALLEMVKDRYVTGVQDRDRQFYICGVGKRVFELRDLLRGAGYERRAVQYERW